MIHPNGIIAEWQYDTAGNANSLSYRIGDESLTFSQTYDMEGRVQTASSVASTQTHKYDRVDRLTQVEDSFGLGPSSSRTCQRREYAFSRDSNRESLTTSGANSEGKCDGSRPLATRSTFDSADRISGGRLQVSYYANDMVAGSKQTVPRANGEGSLLSEYDYDLDPLSRIGSTVLKSDSVVTRTTRNHYVDDSNSPAWSEYVDRSGNSSVASEARFIRSPLGYQAGLQVDRGNAQFYIVNLHGDTVASFDNPASGAVATIGTCRESTEYGISRASLQSPQGGSAWLGAARPEVDSGGGLYAMGMRLYNPHTGRFLSPDPVRGGNDNSYTYPPDPVNSFDLSGEYRTTKWFNPYWTRGGFGIEAGFFVQLTRKEALGTAAGVSITWGIYRAIHAVLEGPKHRAFSRTNMEKFRRTTMRAFGGFAALAASEFVGWYIGVMAWNKKGPFFGLTVSADVRWGRLTVYILPLMLFVSC
ncbi:hypothetical protein KV100_07080 [Mumia sp. zg.B21]|nr:RHS repeat-associated core domain-containing protein [Mumia sp. zg.B21]MBW9209414.1 hypothetical protein [Mumia sp. zg.B21]